MELKAVSILNCLVVNDLYNFKGIKTMQKLLLITVCATLTLSAWNDDKVQQAASNIVQMINKQIEKEGPHIRAAQEAFFKGEYTKFEELVKEHKNGTLFMPSMSALLFHRQCDAQGVKRLINIGCDVDIENKQGVTPLMVAAGHVDHDKVKALLAHGANIANEERQNEVTAVHFLMYTLANSYDVNNAQKASDIFVTLKEHAAAKGMDIMKLPVVSKRTDNTTIKDLLKQIYTETQDKNNSHYNSAVAHRYAEFVKALQVKGII